MKKLAKQVLFNFVIFFASIAAIWLSGSVKALGFISIKECLTADFLFALITTLAGLQGSRWVEGYVGWKPLNWFSGAVQVIFLVVYGVAIPLQGEAFVTSLITTCIRIFAFAVFCEYAIIFWYTLNEDENPNNVASTDRYKNDKH
ncbi:MAG: hypothetical protein IJ274_01975 [Lachnospiraceae bacterium]|nr:hypothetical protein [Lachnospiraceae bacterium]